MAPARCGLTFAGRSVSRLHDRLGRRISAAQHEHVHELDAILDSNARLNRLCELNVIRQVRNVASDIIVQSAWARAQDVSVHGWIYSLANGLVTDLGVTIGGPKEIGRLE